MEKIIELYKKYRSVILYLVFGVLTTIVNIVTYYLLDVNGLFNTVINTSIAWVIAVIFAYVTNKIWVFESKVKGFEANIKEMMSFFACRIATGVMDVVIMYGFVDLMHCNDMIVKIASNVLVVILNYVGSKLFVFKKNDVLKEKGQQQSEQNNIELEEKEQEGVNE